MRNKPPITENVEDYMDEVAAEDSGRYVLRLYITGHTPLSTRALVRIRRICEEHLAGRYELEVVDIAKNPTLAAGEQIVATPTLIKKLPLPLRRFIGDMSQTERILLGLDIRNVQAGDKQPKDS